MDHKSHKPRQLHNHDNRYSGGHADGVLSRQAAQIVPAVGSRCSYGGGTE